MSCNPFRAWINQPSVLQTANRWHGQNVLAISESDNPNMARIFFLHGDIISARVPMNALSKGWKGEQR